MSALGDVDLLLRIPTFWLHALRRMGAERPASLCCAGPVCDSCPGYEVSSTAGIGSPIASPMIEMG